VEGSGLDDRIRMDIFNSTFIYTELKWITKNVGFVCVVSNGVVLLYNKEAFLYF